VVSHLVAERNRIGHAQPPIAFATAARAGGRMIA
jgi:hypothetical protein